MNQGDFKNGYISYQNNKISTYCYFRSSQDCKKLPAVYLCLQNNMKVESIFILWRDIVKLREREGQGVDPGR